MFGQVVSALLKGTLDEDTAGLKTGATSSGGHPGTATAVEASLVYLRDRVSTVAFKIVIEVLTNKLICAPNVFVGWLYDKFATARQTPAIIALIVSKLSLDCVVPPFLGGRPT